MPPSRSVPYQPYVDAHVHIRSSAGVEDLVRAGVVAAREAGTREGTALALRARSDAAFPVIITAGRALVKTGGYGALLGVPVSNGDAIIREIEGLASKGAGIIKVVASGVVSLQRPRTVSEGGFAKEDIRSIVEAAAKHGLAVMCHANGAGTIIAAAEAGVRSIEHGFFMTEDALATLKARGVFWVPTIGALRRAADAADLDPEMQRSIASTIDEHLAMIHRAFTLGVQLAVGTDSVLPHPQYERHYQDELSWFEKAGIPRDDVERIACEGGRRLLQLSDQGRYEGPSGKGGPIRVP
jgi:imidazolonepropionase-like amidohydrolase